MRPAAEAFGLGLLHGPAELLPVSSSAHLALIGRAAQDDVAVAMHAGTAAALLVGLRGEARVALRRFDVGFHLVAGGIPSLCGVMVESRTAASSERDGQGAGARLGSGTAASRERGSRLAAGMVFGAAALLWADRSAAGRSRDEATLLDAAVLGLAQAAALWPGISRSGATLAAARARRFTRPAAAQLSRETAVPLLLGAAAYRLRRPRSRAWAESTPDVRCRFGPSSRAAGAGALGSFAGTLAALPLLRLLERRLWPWSAYRAGVALALVGRSRRV